MSASSPVARLTAASPSAEKQTGQRNGFSWLTPPSQQPRRPEALEGDRMSTLAVRPSEAKLTLNDPVTF